MKKIALAMCPLFVFMCTLSTPFSLNADIADSYFLDMDYSKKISMDFKDASLKDILKIFSQQSGLNFIASEEIIERQITLYLDQVPVEEALQHILTANNLTYELDSRSNIFVVKPLLRKTPELLTRIYHLRNASVRSSKLMKTIKIDTVRDDEEDDDDEEAAAETQNTGIVAAIRTVLSNIGNVIEDPRTNSLIITDIPSQFPFIERTIARLDVKVAQILIEVEMLDVSKTDADKLGIRYGDTPLVFTGGARRFLYPFEQNKILDQGRLLFSTSPGNADSLDSEFVPGQLNATGLSAALQFLKTRTDTRNLARPRILTLNNETAEIKIATSEAIGLQTATDASEGVATQTQQAERVETGVFLTVTPQANVETGEITMAIAPKVIQARAGATFNNQTFRDPEERGSRTVLRVKDGDTIIVGGLLRTDDTKTKTKIPILGDIPFLGAAFRHKDNSETERELIIFITPRIVKEDVQPVFSASNTELLREQDRPSSKIKAVETELGEFEKQRL
jgi:type IV pilus assembly protein PilQ